MPDVRERFVRHFRTSAPSGEPDRDLANAAKSMLWRIEDLDCEVDGWLLFKVIHESEHTFGAIGLMSQPNSGSVPIAVDVSATDSGLQWRVRVACHDERWHGLSESRRWTRVYASATQEGEERGWTWGRQHVGNVTGT